MGNNRSALWENYDRQTDFVKGVALFRMCILMDVEKSRLAGLGKTEAVVFAAQKHGVSQRTIASWIAAVRPAQFRSDWLPLLVPAWRGGGKLAAVDDETLEELGAYFLHPSRPSFASCYKRLTNEYAQPRGIKLPCARTLKRRLVCWLKQRGAFHA